MAGRHRIQYEGGEVYEGEWSAEGKRHGHGVLTFPDRSRFVGQFSQGFFQGPGVLSLPDGGKYEGNFQSGRYHGYGVYTAANGMKFEGQFQDGRAHGLGVVTFADGTHGQPRNEGRFEGERCVERCKATEASRKARQAASSARTLMEQIV